MKKKLSPLLTLILVLLTAFFGYTGTQEAALPPEPSGIYETTSQFTEPNAGTLATVPETPETIAQTEETLPGDPTDSEPETLLDPYGSYTTKEDVALYIHTYGELPLNFMTKSEARSLGWEGGSLDEYAEGMCIGGDHFGNYEGLLPKAPGRRWTECDIDTLYAGSRGVKRIVFSNDGLIYYTDNHYASFELLYGEP